ncbi:MAG: gluconate 2-dehydrogenase subunit 3 family protein [Gemmatimonadales bacterium]
MKRREALGALASAALTTAFRWTPGEAEKAAQWARAAVAAQTSFEPKFFTPHEWQTVRVLVDIVIPRDERSGSATDAGVPEFMDFMLIERSDGQIPMRGGLAWLDAECRERSGKAFVTAADNERAGVLDDIAWPKRAKPQFSQGVAFFNMFRDLTASGFWSSKMGITDLDYRGNEFVREWTGCPPAALQKLGVHYED